MRHILIILSALFVCSVPLHAQTLKSLMFNSTNGQVVANTGTNVLTFTNDVKFANGDLTVSGQVISGSGVSLSFEDGALSGIISLQTDASIAFQGASAAATRANLGFSTNLNTLWTATNASNARSAIGVERVWAYKATNQTNATTNLVSDSALSFTAQANTKYSVELFLVSKSSSSTLQGKISVGTNATIYGTWSEIEAASGFVWHYGNAVTNRANIAATDGADISFRQQFVVVSPTNTNVVVTFQFAPADTNDVSVVAVGSYLKAEVIE